MGCASSFVKRKDNDKIVVPSAQDLHYYSRETRIIQEEEVDVFIDDEYDYIDKDWIHWSGNYEVVELNGEWIEGISSGGSRNDLELFAMNPQYLLSIGPPDKHRSSIESYYSEENKHNTIMVSVCLEQVGLPLVHIAYFIYKTDNEERLSAEYFLVVRPKGESGAFVNWRQVRHEFRLTPGLYVIIPATFLPNTARQFSLAVQTAPPLVLKELTKTNQIV